MRNFCLRFITRISFLQKRGAAYGTPEVRMTPKKRAAIPAFVTPGAVSKMPRFQSCPKIKTPLRSVSKVYEILVNILKFFTLKNYNFQFTVEDK